MNERYIFRGKRIDNGKWVYWNIFGEYTEPYYDAATDTMHSHVSEIDVYQKTVGQYTGLEDKNGVMIFEGDILRDALGWIYEVRWDNENGRFLGYHSKPRGDIYICYVEREPAAEIIGSIHENAELMEATP